MRAVLVVLSFSVAACATASSQAPEVPGSSTVAGVVALPADGSSCEGLSVKATAPGSDQPKGRAAVRQSRGRCSFELYELPSDVELTVQVAPPSSWRCQQVEPASAPVKLKDHETRTVDFKPRC